MVDNKSSGEWKVRRYNWVSVSRDVLHFTTGRARKSITFIEAFPSCAIVVNVVFAAGLIRRLLMILRLQSDIFSPCCFYSDIFMDFHDSSTILQSPPSRLGNSRMTNVDSCRNSYFNFFTQYLVVFLFLYLNSESWWHLAINSPFHTAHVRLFFRHSSLSCVYQFGMGSFTVVGCAFGRFRPTPTNSAWQQVKSQKWRKDIREDQ